MNKTPFETSEMELRTAIEYYSEQKEEHPSAAEYYDERIADCAAGLTLLELAGKFTKDDIDRIGNAVDALAEYEPISDYKCPGRVLKDKFRALLRALVEAVPEGTAGEPQTINPGVREPKHVTQGDIAVWVYSMMFVPDGMTEAGRGRLREANEKYLADKLRDLGIVIEPEK